MVAPLYAWRDPGERSGERRSASPGAERPTGSAAASFGFTLQGSSTAHWLACRDENSLSGHRPIYLHASIRLDNGPLFLCVFTRDALPFTQGWWSGGACPVPCAAEFNRCASRVKSERRRFVKVGSGAEAA